MSRSLDEWQKHLEKHFADLAAARANSDYPLFALEHGLDNVEIAELSALLEWRFKSGLPLRPHWLVGVVYMAEFGYSYDGSEYWPPIETKTGSWDQYRRTNSRSWFRKFRKTYHGVVPSGPWAEQFSIIAWPITHAILPRYLQFQFARTLYEQRYRLAGIGSKTPLAIGKLLSDNAWNASSRFQELLQQEELTGRIVLALLNDQKVEGQSPIYPPTLKRVASDLERVQSAREWLNETRKFVKDRLVGAGKLNGGSSTAGEGHHPPVGELTNPIHGVRPSLLLRRSGPKNWSVVVEIPSFLGVAGLGPELRSFLQGTRCKVSGAGDNWLAAGWLLSGSQRRVLRSWPGSDAPIVRFERTNPILEHLVHSEGRLSRGPIWLFRIGADGLGREITGQVVRPGGKYIVLSENALSASGPLLEECETDCSGIHSRMLSVPEKLIAEDIDWLHRLKLQVARTVRVWPAGLAGRGWDGEGQSEWLASESPCFGIVHDHPVDAYNLRLNNGGVTRILAGGVGSPIFVELAPLPVGKHTLVVKAERSDHSASIPTSPPAEGVIHLEVRNPKPWIVGTTSHVGLTVSLDPHDPDLDTFWEGNFAIDVLGPEGFQVASSIELYSANGKQLLSEQVGTFALPLQARQWQTKMRQFVKGEHRALTFVEAVSGKLVITADELGEYALRLERDVKPLRWASHNTHGSTIVRLIDDTGASAELDCYFCSFGRPASQATCDVTSLPAGVIVPPPGGLLVARRGDHFDTIVVSTPKVEHGLRGLAIEPNLRDLDGAAAKRVLDLLRLWTEARPIGPLVDLRRGRIVEKLVGRLNAELYGSKWAEAEATLFVNSKSESNLQKLEKLVGMPPGFPVFLRRDHQEFEAGSKPKGEWYASAASRYGVCVESELCEFALRLASQPHEILKLTEPRFDQLLRAAATNVTLMRGARFLAVLSALQNTDRVFSLLPRWKW